MPEHLPEARAAMRNARLNWWPCCPGIATTTALLLAIAPAPAGEPAVPEAATRLGVKGTGFTFNDKPSFLYGLSYYGGLGAFEEAIRKDLADAKKCGFNWVRVPGHFPLLTLLTVASASWGRQVYGKDDQPFAIHGLRLAGTDCSRAE